MQIPVLKNWPYFVVLGILLIIWIAVGPASAYEVAGDDGRIIVKPDTARIAYVEGDTPQIVAGRLHAASKSDKEFVRLVYLYTMRNIKYTTDGGWSVKSPEKTMQDRTGDCSEYALLEKTMLTMYGIDARIVYGTIPGTGLHDAVEVHLDHYFYRLDDMELPVFVKIGDGLHPDEKIVW